MAGAVTGPGPGRLAAAGERGTGPPGGSRGAGRFDPSTAVTTVHNSNLSSWPANLLAVIDRDLAARARFLAALEGGQTVSAAARAAGVNRATPYQWAKRGDPELAAAIEQARLRGGRGRRRGAPKGPPGRVAASGPAAGAPEPGDRRERALAVLDQLARDPAVAARDRIAAAAKLVSSLPAGVVTAATPAAAAPETPGDGGRLLVLDRAREFLAKARAT